MQKSEIRLEFNDHIWSPERRIISSRDKKALSLMNSNSFLTTQSYFQKNKSYDSKEDNNSSNINDYGTSNEFEITQTNKLLDSVLVDTNLNIQIDDNKKFNTNMFTNKSISNNSTNLGIFFIFYI